MSRPELRLVSQMPWYDHFLYRLGQFIYRLTLLPWRMRVSGTPFVPKTGGVILASNHISLLDPPIVASSLWRKIHFLAKEELFRIPVLSWYIRHVNAFPVKRYEHDLAAFKNAQRLLNAGEVLLLFPEGRRSKSGEMGKVKAGVGMLACLTQVPVIPVLIENANGMRKLRPIHVTFGPVIFPPAKDALGEDSYQLFSERVMNEIRKLKEKPHG